MDQHSSASVYIMDLTYIFGYFISRKTLEYICNELEKKKQAELFCALINIQYVGGLQICSK